MKKKVIQPKSQAIQLAIFKELEIDYIELQDKQKHLLARKRRAGGSI